MDQNDPELNNEAEENFKSSKTSAFSYNEYLPIPKLGDFIECFWILKGSSKRTGIIQETLVPGGRVELMFSSSPFLWYGADKSSKPISYTGGFLLGQRNGVSYVGFKGDFFLFGIRFKYGCAPLFIKYDAKNSTNKVIPFGESSFGKPLQIEIDDNQESIKKLIMLTEHWLLSCFESPADDWHSLQDLIQQVTGQNTDSIVLGELYEKYGWNYKKAERVFQKYLGFPPRTFLKLYRFRNALEKMRVRPASFTDAAHRLGFYDQSHFIREFYRYTGNKPSSFFKDPPEVAVFLYKLLR